MPSPAINSLIPVSSVAGSSGFTLTLNGLNFLSGAVANWNGSPLTTIFVGPTQLTATVPSGLIVASGNSLVTVVQAGATSPSVVFSVADQPNSIDLTTIADVKAAIESMSQAGTQDDYLLQKAITRASRYFLTRTERASLNSVNAYSRRYDGNNQDSLLLYEWPVTSVTLVEIGPVTIPPTPDYVQPGYAINSDQTGIVLVGSGYYGRVGCVFSKGRMNVRVDHSAGYAGVPEDVADACDLLVAQNYKRRGYLDEASIDLPEGGGTTTYRNWEVPPQVARVISNYRKWR